MARTSSDERQRYLKRRGRGIARTPDTIFNMASALWYQDYLMVLLPWMEPAEQLRFQQWFQQYERNQFLALPRNTDEAQLQQEPAVDRHALPRGSSDPPPA